MSGRVRKYPSLRAFFGVKWSQMGMLALLTTFAVGFEALVLDAVSRIFSMPAIQPGAGTEFSGSGIGAWTEAWSRVLAESRVLGRLIDPTNLYMSMGQQSVLLMLLAVGLLALTRFLEVRQRGSILSRFAYRVREHLITRFFNLKYSVFKQLPGRQVAHLASNEGNQAVQGLMHLLAMFSVGLAGAVYLAVAVFINPVSTGIAFALGGGVFLGLKRISSRLREISSIHLELMTRFNRRMVEVGSLYKYSRITGSRVQSSSETVGIAGRIAASVKLRYDQASKVAALQQPMMIMVLFGVLLFSLGSGLVGLAKTVTALGLIYRGVNCLMVSLTEYNGFVNSSSSIDGLRSFIEYLASSDDDALLQEDHSQDYDQSSVIDRIEIRDLAYSANGVRILDGISFDVTRGEVIGILGHSGSGKSTLLEVMMGLVAPTSGSVRFNGTLIQEFIRSGGRRRIAYVGSEMLVSETALLGQLSLRVNSPSGVADFIKILGELGCGDLAPELISKVTEASAYERSGQLSMGQKQVLILVNELMRRPDVLVLDEVTAHMDPSLTRRVYSHLKAITDHMVTIVVSHNLEILDHCSRLVVLKGGVMVASGAPESLRDKVSSSEFFQRSPHFVGGFPGHILTNRAGLIIQVAHGDMWLAGRLEELSTSGVGWVWEPGAKVLTDAVEAHESMVSIEFMGRRLLLSGAVEEWNEIGGRLCFVRLSSDSIEALSWLMRELENHLADESAA